MLYILRITLVRIKLSTSTVKHSLEISRENQFYLFILFSFLGLLLSYCYQIYYLKPNKRKNLITCIGKNDTNTVYRKPTSHRMIHVCFKEKKKYILVWTSVLPLHLPLPACSSVRHRWCWNLLLYLHQCCSQSLFLQLVEADCQGSPWGSFLTRSL